MYKSACFRDTYSIKPTKVDQIISIKGCLKMILGMHFFKQVSVKTNCILVFSLKKHIHNKQKYYNWWIIFFFLEKQLFKQDDSSTDSGALTGGIVTISIVLLAVGIIVAIYRK